MSQEHPSYENLLALNEQIEKEGRRKVRKKKPLPVPVDNGHISDTKIQIHNDAMDIKHSSGKHSTRTKEKRKLLQWLVVGMTVVAVVVLLVACLIVVSTRQGPAPFAAQPYYAKGALSSNPLLRDCQGAKLKQTFPNMDYALLGYNVLKGYPLAVGHDPGFTLPIFSSDYSAGDMSADCRYNVPKGVLLVSDVSCVIDFSSDVVRTTYEFSKALSMSASVHGRGWGAAFSASAGYKESSSQMTAGSSVFIFSRANCNYYYMKLQEDDAPPFHPVFLKWIIKLNKSDDQELYLQFFEKFGTHFLREAKFGASYTYEYKMSSKDYKAQMERGYNVAVAASYTGLYSVGGEFKVDGTAEASISEFQKKTTKRTITIGAPPTEGGDAVAWASTVKESPVPVSYELASIEELFSETFMGVPSMQRYGINHRRIAETIKATKGKYCEVLQAKGLVDDCTEVPPGLTMEDTEIIGNPMDKVRVNSHSKCIDECSRHVGCVAVKFCTHCSRQEFWYNTCYLYSEKFVNNGQRDTKWESTVVLPELDNQIVLENTAVEGSERSPAISRSAKTLQDCRGKCMDDLFCVAFTFTSNPSKSVKCRLYSEVRMSLRKEPNTKTYFIARRQNK